MRPRARARLAALALAAAWLLPVMGAMAQPAAPRLLVMDLPYARVWEGAVRALEGYGSLAPPMASSRPRASERAPLPGEEAGAERIAERVTVRVEAVGEKVTRVTVTVAAEALRDGSWQAVGASPATARTVLDRIRASIG